MAEQEEEVIMEVEAVEAVYGDYCTVLKRFPPHLHLHLKPRTADIDSQQFVEATIELRAGPQYPSDPPYVDIIGSKGLDEERQKLLRAILHDKANELSSCLMIVALSEEAVEILSNMNHPEGDCPLCLYPLVPENELDKPKPFMKLMSCFHCFHCDCIIRWLKWYLTQNEAYVEASSALPSSSSEEISQALDLCDLMRDRTGNCPVCRKVFLAKDIEHVLNSADSHGSNLDVDEKEITEELLKCPLETSRRRNFEVILELQQQHGGLIEPPKDNILFSRLSIQDLIPEDTEVSNGESSEQGQVNEGTTEDLRSSTSSDQSRQAAKQHQRYHTTTADPAGGGAEPQPSTSQLRHSGLRKHVRRNPRVHAKQWSRKE